MGEARLLRDWEFVARVFREFTPDAIVHYAEQPSAPYSLIDYKHANDTLANNLLVTNNPGVWDAYLELNQFVYAELKTLYPDLPVMVSLFGLALLDGYRGEDDHA